jgi:hypothetical protein
MFGALVAARAGDAVADGGSAAAIRGTAQASTRSRPAMIVICRDIDASLLL